MPQASRAARGVPVPSVLPVDRSTRIKGLLAVAHDTLQNPKAGDDDELFLVVLTRNGLVKKTPLAAFKGLTSRGLIAIKLEKLEQFGIEGWLPDMRQQGFYQI